MRMCIEEVEKRGLNTKNIYSSQIIAEVYQLRRMFESENTFSFGPTDNIQNVAMLLWLYVHHLPEPLFMLSLQDYRQYGQNRARYSQDGFSVLRSKIHELHPVQRASLGALLQHFLRVASHSDKNAMTVKALAARFRYVVLNGNYVLHDGVHMKDLVMQDLIQNAHTLFEERPSPSPPVPSPHVAETTSIFTYGSLFLSPELSQPAEVELIGSTTQHGPGLVGGVPMSIQTSFSSLLSEAATESRLTPPTPLLSPLLGFPSSKRPTGVKTTTQKQVIPEARGTKAVETLAISPVYSEVVSVLPASVAEWRLQVPQSRLAPHPEAPTTPRSPLESVLSSTSDFTLSSATSLQTIMPFFDSP